MASCLGIYIDDNVIKYAKVAKEHESIKIEAYGIKFYDNVEKTVEQIINETYSYKVPVSSNISDEQYTYIDIFSLLSKKDFDKAIDTEFEMFCTEYGKNKPAIEYRTDNFLNLNDEDKKTVIYCYTNKSSVMSRLQELDGCNVVSMSPIGITIPLINDEIYKENSLVINIEDKTTITTIVEGKPYRVDIIESGMKKILSAITAKENSIQKAYEICKNSTIYTMSTSNLQESENEYMTYIMPVLYNIVEDTKEVLAKNKIDIKNIYISGLATAINNIDLYFQENFIDKKCEILTPSFVDTANLKIDIQDYIEVNSAISLAISNLSSQDNKMNFKKESVKEKLSKKVSIPIDIKKPEKKIKEKEETKDEEKVKNDLKEAFNNIEKGMLRVALGFLALIILYSISAKIVSNNIYKKDQEILATINDTKEKIKALNDDTKAVNTKASQYEEYLAQMDEANLELNERNANKNAIPSLLKNIQAVIPEEVQLLYIKNTTSKHIQIKAQAEKYEQIGFFIAKLKNDGILTNVTSDSGTKSENIIQITIDGDLPII